MSPPVMNTPAIRLSFAAACSARVTVRSCSVPSRPPRSMLKSIGGGASVILAERSKTRYEPRSISGVPLSPPSAAMIIRKPSNSTRQPPAKITSAANAPSIDVRKFFMEDGTVAPFHLSTSRNPGPPPARRCATAVAPCEYPDPYGRHGCHERVAPHTGLHMVSASMSEPNQLLTTNRKALTINLADAQYGTFAEIGAGQEVSRVFFQAGGVSKTIAKTISAYDMTFSDAIYGKAPRYVSRERLSEMRDHEYHLLIERLAAERGDRTTFFVFADTVATKNFKATTEAHVWMGVRFQTAP